MDLETANYITHYYSKFYNEKESRASAHWSCEFKIMHSSDKTDEGREKRRRVNLKSGRMTTDPEILKLLSGGIDEFKINTASRILKDHPKKIFLNACRKCHALARTPVAKQCKRCGFNWHNELIATVISHSFFQRSPENFFMECHIASGKIEKGTRIDFYPFDMFEKGTIEEIETKNEESGIGKPIRTIIKISGLSISSQDFLLEMKYSKQLEVLSKPEK